MFRVPPRPLQPINKRSPDDKSDKHLAFIRQLPCCICRRTPSEAAHVRANDPRHGKFQALGQKPPDRFTVPLCSTHHREGPGAQHVIGEAAFWQRANIDPAALALALWNVSGNLGSGGRIVAEASRIYPHVR